MTGPRQKLIADDVPVAELPAKSRSHALGLAGGIGAFDHDTGGIEFLDRQCCFSTFTPAAVSDVSTKRP